MSGYEGKGEILVWCGPAGWNPLLGQVAKGREFRVGKDITAEQAELLKGRRVLVSRKDAKAAKETQDAKSAKEAQTQEREEG